VGGVRGRDLEREFAIGDLFTLDRGQRGGLRSEGLEQLIVLRENRVSTTQARKKSRLPPDGSGHNQVC
jgi:hypothetical protein